MRKKLFWTLGACAALALAVAAIAAAEKPTTIKAGNLVFTINGSFSPKALPKKEMAPIALSLSGKIGTADGTHPPALKEVVVLTDKNGTNDTRGVPTCTAAKLEAQTTANAEKVCKAAIVGSGTTMVEVEFPEQKPITIQSKLLAFNGGSKGNTTTIFVHAFLTSPVTAAVVTTVKIQKVHMGPYGIKAIAYVPKIAGGAGSPTFFSLTFPKRLYTYKGKKHGYLMAKCATGHFLANGEAIFANGEKLGGKVVRACTPKG
jgi:hypothetical protein